MSGIGAVPTAKSQLPVEEHQLPERDGGKRSPPRHPGKPQADSELVDVEPHQLDVEA